MSEELEKLLADGEKKDQSVSGANGKKDQKTPEQIKEEEKVKAEEHLTNIRKAIVEGNTELKKIRDAKKQGKTVEQIEDEEIPNIDFNDKGAKAWEKHISGKVNPIQEELDKEKEEIRTFAIKEFLSDKPELARDQEKLKKVIGTYEKIRTASERTTQGVLLDLRKAYAAEYADEILQDNQDTRLERAAGEAIFSDIAISRGSSSYRDEKEASPKLSNDDESVLAKWGMSKDEWVKLKKARETKK